MAQVRVLLADDHPVFLDGLKSVFAAVPDLEIVGTAGTGDEALRAAQALGPDVVVMDLRMPEGGGVEATRRITGLVPDTVVLVLTMFEDDEWVFAAMRAGARGYLLKGAEPADIVQAIRSVARGEAIFGAGIARRIIDYFAAAVASGAVHPFPELTARERDVLDLMARGLNNAAIARRLVLQPKSVRNRVSSIFAKLRVADRAEAIVRAREAGLGRSGAG